MTDFYCLLESELRSLRLFEPSQSNSVSQKSIRQQTALVTLRQDRNSSPSNLFGFRELGLRNKDLRSRIIHLSGPDFVPNANTQATRFIEISVGFFKSRQLSEEISDVVFDIGAKADVVR